MKQLIVCIINCIALSSLWAGTELSVQKKLVRHNIPLNCATKLCLQEKGVKWSDVEDNFASYYYDGGDLGTLTQEEYGEKLLDKQNECFLKYSGYNVKNIGASQTGKKLSKDGHPPMWRKILPLDSPFISFSGYNLDDILKVPTENEPKECEETVPMVELPILYNENLSTT